MTSRTSRRFWWRLHHWAGLLFSILTGFMFLTGTLAVFGHELDWAARPAMRVDASTVNGPPNYLAMMRALREASPRNIILALAAPYETGFAATATLVDDDGYGFHVYLHPTTGAVQGRGPELGIQQGLRQVHRRMMLPIPIGVPLVSALSLLLLTTFVSAIFVYKKWWRGFGRGVRVKAGARTAWGDYHRLVGVWSLWFIALVTATSLWYFVESIGGEARAYPVPPGDGYGYTVTEANEFMEGNLLAVHASAPDLRVSFIQFPGGRTDAMAFYGQEHAVLVRETANVVWTAPETAVTVARHDARDMDWHQRISEAADPLHFGTWGRLASRIVWSLFGLLLTSMAVSGAAIYAQRVLHHERAPAPFGRATWRALVGMGLGGAIAIALVASCVLLLADWIRLNF